VPIRTCPVCGRVIVTTVPLETLPRDERRCPRCGFDFGNERGHTERPQNRRRRDDGTTTST